MDRTQFDLLHNHDGINSQQIDAKNVANLLNTLSITEDLLALPSAVNPILTVNTQKIRNHTYLIGGYITVTAIATNTITLQVTYTDENGTSRTQSFFGQGLTTAAVSTTGAFTFPPMIIRVGAGQSIIFKTVIVGAGSQTYDCGVFVQQIN